MSKDFTGSIAFTKVKDIYISTVDLSIRRICEPFAGIMDSFFKIEDKYETAIKLNDNWIIVNVYAELEEAEKGHKNIVEQCRKGKTDWEELRM